ncbi:MAG: LuxR C-terminal-related transcriptional regulator [Spirochaetaceae bacterium]
MSITHFLNKYLKINVSTYLFRLLPKREKEYLNQIKVLEEELLTIRERLKIYIQDYIDPIEAGLTSAELILLENLCCYKESNSQLGLRLKKSENTVKVQLTNIMNKIGADDRHQLIDLCRFYYLKMKELKAFTI